MERTQEATTPKDRFWPLILPLIGAEMVGSLELTMIYAAMRSLIADFGSASAAGWLVTSFMLASAAGAALFGRLGDVLGRRRILLIVLMLATTGSIISAFSRELGWLIVGRAMQGAAGAIIPLCFGMVRERVAPERVAFGIGLLAGAASISSGLGLVLGGIIIDLADWTMIFKVTAIAGAIAFIANAVLVSPDRVWNPGAVRDDLLGGMLFVPAAVGLLMAIDNIGHAGWGDRMTFIYAAVAAISLAAWIWRELSVSNPLIQLRLLATRDIGWANVVLLMLTLGAFQCGQIMALLGQQRPSTGAGLGLSATVAGLLLLPANAIAATSSPFVGRMVQSHGPRLIASLGFLSIALAFAALVPLHHSVWTVVPLLIVQNVGLMMVYVTVPTMIVSASPADRVSEATGVMTVIRSTGQAIGAQTVATLLSGTAGHAMPNTRFPGEQAYIAVFLFICVTATIGMLLSRLLPTRLMRNEGMGVH